jgi:hypothetical protein
MITYKYIDLYSLWMERCTITSKETYNYAETFLIPSYCLTKQVYLEKLYEEFIKSNISKGKYIVRIQPRRKHLWVC